MDLRPILDIFAKDMGLKGGGRVREQWWRQKATKLHLKATLKEFQHQHGSGGKGNLAGVVRAREGRKSWNLVVSGQRGEGTEFSRFSGMGTGNDRVGR